MANGATIRIGDPAPVFSLPAINRDGDVRLDDYVGRAPLFLNVLRGLHCPFCRRNMVRLADAKGDLDAMGVQILLVVSTVPDRARRYLAYRPTPLLVASDPGTTLHRALGLPRVVITESETDWPHKATADVLHAPLPDPTGEFPGARSLIDLSYMLNDRDGYRMEAGEEEADSDDGMLLEGHMMIDRDGVVRWLQVEASHSMEGFSRTPTRDEILQAARDVAG